MRRVALRDVIAPETIALYATRRRSLSNVLACIPKDRNKTDTHDRVDLKSVFHREVMYAIPTVIHASVSTDKLAAMLLWLMDYRS